MKPVVLGLLIAFLVALLWSEWMRHEDRERCNRAARIIRVTDMAIKSKMPMTIPDAIAYHHAHDVVKSPICLKHWED